GQIRMQVAQRVEVGAKLPGVSADVVTQQAQAGERGLRRERAERAERDASIQAKHAAIARRGADIERIILHDQVGARRYAMHEADLVEQVRINQVVHALLQRQT